MQVDISQLISISAVRSAAKVIYSSAITTATPIGLRNDPHTAAILDKARQVAEELDAGADQLDPFERRDYQEWINSESGAAYLRWRARALPLASALELVDEAWQQQAPEEDRPTQVDPKLQRLADWSWWFENHGIWFLGGAFCIVFALFFGIGPSRSTGITVLTITGLIVALLLVAIYLLGKSLPALTRWYAQRQGSEVPTLRSETERDPLVALPLWREGDLSGASVFNHANWALLSQPGESALLTLTPPQCRWSRAALEAEDTPELSARQREIALTLIRTQERLTGPGNLQPKASNS